jgi:DNA repair exonuclease SbcCD ATPase subunit
VPDAALRDLVLKRLDEATDKDAGTAWYPLVLAALEGPEELARQIDDEGRAETPPRGLPAVSLQGAGGRGEGAEAHPRVALLRSISVEGFRGIGEKAALDLVPGPGLTLVVGRNGSGKSSFAEGLELLLTSQTYRWKDRSLVWKGGFRNLHHKKTALGATLALEGEKDALTVVREWKDEAALEEGETWAQVHGKPRGELKALGWAEALESYRPFLSYNELGEMLVEGPSQLYDALARILGLDDLVRAQNGLGEARSLREKLQKDVERERKELLDALAGSADERSVKTRAVLAKKEKGLADIESVVLGSTLRESDSDLEVLRRLSVLHVAPVETARQIVQAVRDAVERQRRAAAGIAGKADDLAGVLERALHFHDRHGDGDCPVCGRSGALDSGWYQLTTEELKRLQEAARDASEAKQALAVAYANLRKITAGEWPLLERATQLPLGEVSEVARGLLHVRETAQVDAIQDPAALAEAVDKTIPPYTKLLVALHVTAAAELTKREDAWRPFARRVQDWLPRARAAYYGARKLVLLKHAEKWLEEAAETIRNDRFAPIAEHAMRIWDQLKLQSNVSLARIQLKGDSKSNRRSVELDVTVDGQEGAALGVMSQGELHSLALSLFIPRATLPESPFRFVVIDDPVQSMDPARVDGLARVLEAAGRDRQVLVFTHDERLPEAIRRLAIDATVIEVTRREGSIVETRRVQHARE